MRRICVAVILAVLAVDVADAQFFCWNLENYFDAVDAPETADEAFTPGGEHHWNRRKFEAKRNLIAKTIIASAECFEGDLPAVVGLCEVENAAVLRSLLEDTPLAKFRYRSVHRESPDPRGIDVALLYDPERVQLLASDFITIKEFATREILYAKVALRRDTLHIYVNHWPSKYSGAKVSEVKRQAVCDALLTHLDSLMAVEPDAKVIAMGDFNDTPQAASIVRLCERAGLEILSKNISGTIKFKGKWETIDQVLTSPAAAAIIGAVDAYSPDFLLEEDKSFMVGPRYNGGASDHLPIVAKLLE